MATESFKRPFIVDGKSAPCMQEILKDEKSIIINKRRTFSFVTTDELKKMFGNGKNK